MKKFISSVSSSLAHYYSLTPHSLPRTHYPLITQKLLSTLSSLNALTLPPSLPPRAQQFYPQRTNTRYRSHTLSGACVDESTADQLIVYMALSCSPSCILCEPTDEESSLHLQTAILIASELTGARLTVYSTKHSTNSVLSQY